MVQEFEIMKILDLHNRGQFIFVRQINVGSNFEVKEGSKVGGVPVQQYLDIPRILDDNQHQRLDVFVFRPLDRISSKFFKEGQLVELIIPD
ncbi:MAG: hypothetical protein SGI83_03080 [Bacteroidota bacterium]|nr:hypothetical protein [Bacteroidota bacterium]